MKQSRENRVDAAHLGWTVALLVGLGAFVSIGGLAQLLAGIPLLSLLVGVFSGALVSFSVHLVATERLGRTDGTVPVSE